MPVSQVTRRQLMGRSLLGAASLLLSAPACRPPGRNICDDLSELSDTERATRLALGYRHPSDQPGRNCANCSLFVVVTTRRQCGTCRIVRGPIHPAATCNSWAASAG